MMTEKIKNITCGILISCNGSFLLGHSTNNTHWDIFKGLNENNESYKETALRETFEESGLDLKGCKLKELGLFKLNNFKDVVLFEVEIGSVDIDSLNCTSMVKTSEGEVFPEIDGFKLFSREEVLSAVSKSLRKILINLI